MRGKLVLFSSIFLLSSCTKYVEFKPIEYNEDKLKEVSAPITKDYSLRLSYVLKYYNEDFKIENDSILFIKQDLKNDKQLIWNYTSKANDKEWLKSH